MNDNNNNKSCMYTAQGEIKCNKITETFSPTYINDFKQNASSECSYSSLPYPVTEWESKGNDKHGWIGQGNNDNTIESFSPPVCPKTIS